MRIKVSRILSLALATILALLPVTTAQAVGPLTGTMDLEYNLLVPGLQDEIPDWVGTITIDGEEYGMLFFAIGSGKSFDDAWVGKIHFFEEIWAIYDTDADFTELLPSDDSSDWVDLLPKNDPEELVLWGYDYGQTNIQTSKYHMNGVVEEASGPFTGLEGYSVHMNGVIEWQNVGTPEEPIMAPHYAPGSFRIN